MADVMDSDTWDDLVRKLNARQIGVKAFRTALRLRLQRWGDDNILTAYVLATGHMMVHKAQEVKPVRHFRIVGEEARKECLRRMSMKKK